MLITHLAPRVELAENKCKPRRIFTFVYTLVNLVHIYLYTNVNFISHYK